MVIFHNDNVKVHQAQIVKEKLEFLLILLVCLFSFPRQCNSFKKEALCLTKCIL